jgi:hypothetical protein
MTDELGELNDYDFKQKALLLRFATKFKNTQIQVLIDHFYVS